MTKAGRVTIVDVARAAGTSVSSASVALRGEPGVSEELRRRILRTADRLGYRPDQRARMLREQSSRLLGVTFAVPQAFHADVVECLYAAVADTGYDLVLSATTGTRTELQAVESLLQDRCAALVLVSPEIGNLDLATVEQAGSCGHGRVGAPRGVGGLGARRRPARDPDGGRPPGRGRAPRHPLCGRWNGGHEPRPPRWATWTRCPRTASPGRPGSWRDRPTRSRGPPRPRSCWPDPPRRRPWWRTTT